MAALNPLEYTVIFFFYRLVYKWFYFLYKLSYALGVIGYVIMMAAFFGLSLIFNVQPQSWIDVAILLIFYGLYYGVLGRDIAEICADKMASHIGVSSLPLKAIKKLTNKFVFYVLVLQTRRNAD